MTEAMTTDTGRAGTIKYVLNFDNVQVTVKHAEWKRLLAIEAAARNAMENSWKGSRCDECDQCEDCTVLDPKDSKELKEALGE